MHRPRPGTVGPAYPEGVHITGIEDLVIGAAAVVGLVFLLVVIVLTAATTLMVRRVRRRWQALRRPVHLRPSGSRLSTRVPAIDRRRLAATGASLATTLASARWWATQRDRHRMWRAVTAAKHAVAVARRSGAPVGDLPALASRLEAAARSADALARAAALSPRGGAPASTDARQIEEAALEMHRAAVDSLQAVTTAEVSPLLPSVLLEVQAVTAGIRAVSALRRPAT